MAKEKLPLVTVVGTGSDNKVLLFERHSDHPEEGEAFLSNDGISREVAETPEVKRLLSEGRLAKSSKV